MATFSSLQGSLNIRTPDMDFKNPEKSYRSAYNAYTDLNQQLFANQMGGHAQRIQQAQAAQQELMGSYRGLQQGVMRKLAGTNRANLMDIADKYTTLSGQMSQQMIDRGLGNTTVQQSMQRGIARDHAAEGTRSRGQFAQLQANYLTKIGTERLQAMQQGNAFLSGLQGDQLAMMERISAPPPDPGMYAQLAMAASRGNAAGPGQLPAMPGQHGGFGGRPIGGVLANPPSYGGGGYSDAMPSSGANLFSGYFTGGGATAPVASFDNFAPVSSGYGRDSYGGLVGNEQVGPQLAADYSGLAASAMNYDYSNLNPVW